MKPKTLAPIALFVYKRLDHARKTVDALKSNILAEESELFIFSDGPKGASDAEGVRKVREYIRSIDGFKRVEIRESSENKGLAASITSGVTEIVDRFGKAIVLEDDIVSSPYFLVFMNEALELYKDEPRVMHVSGYFFPHPADLPESFFYNQMLCWGWATWKRAWDSFSFDVDKHIACLAGHPELGRKMYLRNALSTLRANKAGRAKTWAAFWQACITEKDGFCLNPGVSYAANIGNDGTGENSGASDVFDTATAQSQIFLSRMPLEESREAVEIGNKALRAARGSLARRALRRLKRLFMIK